jgi:hypothetical protein
MIFCLNHNIETAAASLPSATRWAVTCAMQPLPKHHSVIANLLGEDRGNDLLAVKPGAFDHRISSKDAFKRGVRYEAARQH